MQIGSLEKQEVKCEKETERNPSPCMPVCYICFTDDLAKTPCFPLENAARKTPAARKAEQEKQHKLAWDLLRYVLYKWNEQNIEQRNNAKKPECEGQCLDVYELTESRLYQALSEWNAQKKALRLPQVSRNENGKPYFNAQQSVSFNLSHCRGACCCVIGASPFEFGIDVECPAFAAMAKDSFIRLICSASERSYLENSADESEKKQRFFRIWTAKESFGKAMGNGLSYPWREAFVYPAAVEDKHVLQWLYQKPETDRKQKLQTLPAQENVWFGQFEIQHHQNFIISICSVNKTNTQDIKKKERREDG